MGFSFMGFAPQREVEPRVQAAIKAGNIQYFRAITDDTRIQEISSQHIVRTNPNGTRTFQGDDILSCAALHQQFELCKFFLMDDNWKSHTKKMLFEEKRVGFFETKTAMRDFVTPLQKWFSEKANQNDEDRALLVSLQTASNSFNERPSVAARMRGHGPL